MNMCSNLRYAPIVRNENTGKRKLKIYWKDSVNNLDTTPFDELVEIYQNKYVGSSYEDRDGEKWTIEKFTIVPCGHCPECVKRHSQDWATRCLLEERSLEERGIEHLTYYITLTYSDPCLPTSLSSGLPSLCKKDVSVKWLGTSLHHHFDPLGVKMKYFLCGEYGDHKGRPHYHLILWLVSNKPLDRDETSKFLSSSWKFGISDIQIPNSPNCYSYVSRYVDKKQLDSVTQSAYEKLGIQPVFLLVSKGIGSRYLMDHMEDIFKYGYIQGTNGFRNPIPRYFFKLVEGSDVDLFKKTKARLLENQMMATTAKQFQAEMNGKKFSDYMKSRESAALLKLRARKARQDL